MKLLYRRSLQRTPSTTIIRPNSCIFQAIREAAKVKNDSKIIRLCETLDLIASEAQYHNSCYHNYARSVATLPDGEIYPKSSTEESQPSSEQTQIDETSIFQTWSNFIEKSFFKSRETTAVTLCKTQNLLKRKAEGD